MLTGIIINDMEEKKDTPPPIIDQLKEYAETRLKLAKYSAIEGGTTLAASLIADVVTAFAMVLAFVFASITLGFYLADDVFKSNWEGFGCVAVIYLLLAVLIKANKKYLERPIVNAFIKKILN
jgi:hypothetical protein